MLFRKGYLNKNETKALAAVSKIRDQEKLLTAVGEISNNTVREAAVKQLDESHLVRYIRDLRKDSTMRSNAIKLLKNQEELMKIVSSGDEYGIYEKAAAVENLDEAHATQETLKKIAMNAEGGGFGVHAEDGLAAVKKLEDQETLLAIATEANDGLVRINAAKKLEERDKIFAFLMKTNDSYSFKTLLPKIELTGEEKQKLSDEAVLKNDSVMKVLFTEDQMYEKCIQKKDPELAKSLWKNIWDREKLEALNGILGAAPEAERVQMRLRTIQHMDNLKQKGFPAEINERTIVYNSTLENEISLLGTVKHTVEKQGMKIGFDDVYEKAGDELSSAVASKTRLVLTYFLGGPLLGNLMIMGPKHWLSENAKDAIWMVLASLQLSDTENVMKRVSADMSDEEAATLIRDILRTWWVTVA
ncbi:MAG: hypothetical protein IKE15_09075 [Clostridia bacterium]|nr:hypothetical protein [Clostridia bacterium]MBR2663637.1 hypothetical protein [Clostridia bacterium]